MPRTNNRVIACATTLFLAAFMAGCVDPTQVHQPGEGLAARDVTIVMQDFAYAPAKITLGVGSTVTWTNKDSVGHTVTPVDKAFWGSQGSGDASASWLANQKSWSFTFAKPGTYDYYCIPHSSKGADGADVGMVGRITIVGEGEAAPAPDVSARVVPSPLAPSPTGRTEPARVAIELETKEVRAQLADGASYEFWTFNATVPGPMLRVHQGDTVDFTLHNAADSKNPHSIDFHAVTGPGGGAKATQTMPGNSSSFSFQALRPGLYVYHCATTHIPTHVSNGMYGLIFVEPDDWRPVDREYFVVQGEVYTDGALGDQGEQHFSHDKMMDEHAEYYIFNGRVGALSGPGALHAMVNETVRIYFGVGGMVPSNFHVIGEIFDRVFPEGSMAAPQESVQTTLVPAGGSTIVEFKVEVPGDYLLVDHWLTHAIDRGAVGILQVDGPQDHSIFSGATSGGSGH